MSVVAPAFTCTVAAAHDGDTITCTNGRKIRLAGIEANEINPAFQRRTGRPCHLDACPAMPAQQARRVVERLVLHRTLTCQPVGRSYSRVVATCRFADGRRLECAVVAARAANVWPAYWRRYRLEACR